MSEDRPTVGVVDSPAGDDIANAVTDAGVEPAVGSAEALADASLAAVVAPDRTALHGLADHPPAAPVLAPGASPGLPGIDGDALATTLEAVLSDRASTVPAPLLSVTAAGEPAGRALEDVTIVTEAPASISEFAIEHATAGELEAGRADGVVLATPAGSHGYASAGGGPLLAPGAGLAVVPIAPFRFERQRWVVPVELLSVAVTRDEARVSVEVDGVVEATLDGRGTVDVRPAGTLSVVVPSEDAQATATGGAEADG